MKAHLIIWRYQGQSHLPWSRSDTKVTFQKTAFFGGRGGSSVSQRQLVLTHRFFSLSSICFRVWHLYAVLLFFICLLLSTFLRSKSTIFLCLSLYSEYSCLSLFINPFPNKPWFLRVSNTSLFKTLSFLPVLKTFCHFHKV